METCNTCKLRTTLACPSSTHETSTAPNHPSCWKYTKGLLTTESAMRDIKYPRWVRLMQYK